jgi:hypothetical protein
MTCCERGKISFSERRGWGVIYFLGQNIDRPLSIQLKEPQAISLLSVLHSLLHVLWGTTVCSLGLPASLVPKPQLIMALVTEHGFFPLLLYMPLCSYSLAKASP